MTGGKSSVTQYLNPNSDYNSPVPTKNGYLSISEPLMVKQQYWKEMPPETEFDKLPEWSNDFKKNVRSKTCYTCNNLASQMLCIDVDGIMIIEKYCESCKKEGKHIKENNELMKNFDNLFIKAEPKP